MSTECFLFSPGQRSENNGVWVASNTAEWRVEVWQRDNRVISYTFKRENDARTFYAGYSAGISDAQAFCLTN